ncbi:MAG: flagellar basal body-associated FliL family protein [Nitriliruptoraceae bacterium]|nr:flagellar basal body-associated FliL family protein [Nitriliruptoraceae bacterium]
MTTMTLEPELEEPTRRRWPLIAGAVLLVLLLGGGAAWWFLGSDADAAEEPVIEEGEILVLEAQTTSLGLSQTVHARVGVAVVLAEGVRSDDVRPRIPLLQDALIQELSQMSAEQLRSTEGAEELRSQLTVNAQRIWDEETVVRVVLTELVVN